MLVRDKHNMFFASSDGEILFITLIPGANVIKLFTAVSYAFS
jgi:hypothetical protein